MRSQSQESLVSMPVKSAAGQEMQVKNPQMPLQRKRKQGGREKWCLNIYTIVVEDIGTQ